MPEIETKQAAILKALLSKGGATLKQVTVTHPKSPPVRGYVLTVPAMTITMDGSHARVLRGLKGVEEDYMAGSV